jgi:MFS transporter, ACS family, pantothenate transporter
MESHQAEVQRPASPGVEKDTASVNLGSSSADDSGTTKRRPLSKRILAVVWDSLDKTPEERAFIAKIDWWILSYCCIAYFVKYLDQTNVCRCP